MILEKTLINATLYAIGIFKQSIMTQIQSKSHYQKESYRHLRLNNSLSTISESAAILIDFNNFKILNWFYDW